MKIVIVVWTFLWFILSRYFWEYKLDLDHRKLKIKVRKQEQELWEVRRLMKEYKQSAWMWRVKYEETIKSS